jgi:hypothetical protein
MTEIHNSKKLSAFPLVYSKQGEPTCDVRPHRAPKAPWLREGVSCVPQRLAFVCQLFEPGQCFSVFCAAD